MEMTRKRYEWFMQMHDSLSNAISKAVNDYNRIMEELLPVEYQRDGLYALKLRDGTMVGTFDWKSIELECYHGGDHYQKDYFATELIFATEAEMREIVTRDVNAFVEKMNQRKVKTKGQLEADIVRMQQRLATM